ncbi:hypothetical protein K1W69_01680 [Hoeflea sp. WL0058]|uniref:Uncharacterized protein n=1 Tax=Flavimaribacter sediminis TaxID=2865987 RepID=A0AAE2ZKA1_9HYPH|nr:hypothetical protein [Flavimaribacter sediminis]MBW8635878.1 hypothetical protein [Flavimaribacter sediminis]
MNMITFTNALTAIAIATVIGGVGSLGVTTQAVAATDIKPTLSVSGKSYYQKEHAKNSAVGRWEKKAVIQHGMNYGKWGQAKQTSFDCNSKFHQGNGKKLWTCKASGKPVANVKMCASGKIRARWYHPNKAGAQKGVKDAWEKLAAAEHGMKYSFYKNATNKHFTCGADSQFPGKITCNLSATPCK